uniref:Autophagy-related protein 27 n=1 Tax=Moniliophthora roreri TaxID=221103 RepID=A0A0W0FGG8_MONRR
MFARAPWHFSLVLLLSAHSILAAPSEEKPCTIHSDDGKYYDLNPLKASKDYQVQTPGGKEFYLNICRGVATEAWGLDDAAEVGGFIRRDHGDFSVGRTNTTLVMSDGKPKLRMTGGSKCKTTSGGEGDPAATVIEFVCDTSVFGSGTPRLSEQIPLEDEYACAFFIEWKTHFACPTGERGGPWGFFAGLVAIFLILLMLYVVFGTLYNRYVLQLRGFDQIPQFSLEAMKYHSREALDWFKDVMSSFYEGGQRTGMGGLGGGVGGFRGGFAPVGRRPAPGPRRNPTNPVSHQAQVDVGSGGDGGEGGDFVGGFVRPTGTPRSQNTRPSTNPISHQSQVNAQQQQQRQQQSPPREPTPPLPQAKSVAKDTGPATREERAFMLGDDDEEEDVATAAAPAKGNEPAAAPGRDSGDQGAIRL